MPSSQLQRFCRDLHTEAADLIVTHVAPVAVQPVLLHRLTDGRKLDSGNPNPPNIGSDFGRFEMPFFGYDRDEAVVNRFRKVVRMAWNGNKHVAADEEVPAVGSRVKLLWGGYPVEAGVIEDRGNLGAGGRRLLRIRLDLDPNDVAEPVEFEMPAADVKAIKP